MVEINDIRKNFRLLIVLIGGGGIITLMGLSLPYFTISIPGVGTVVLDGFEIYFVESILQLIGCLLALTAACMIYLYFKKPIESNIDKKFENVMLISMMSLFFSIIGLGITAFDIVNAILIAAEGSVKNPISVQIGFFISIIGPIVTFLGFIFLIKLVKT